MTGPASTTGGVPEPDSARDMPPDLPSALRRRRALARAALWWQRAWPALWPALAVLIGFAILALVDVLPALPGWLHLGTLALFASGFLVALYRSAGALRAPGAAAADRYLEGGDDTAHRPLAALADRRADRENPAGAALWRAHRRRMLARAARLRPRLPAAGLARRDPWGLRAALAALLVIAASAAGNEAPARFLRAVAPSLGGAGAAVAFDVWVTPPAYTGRAPLFLRHQAADAPIELPRDSLLTARLTGGRGGAVLTLDAARFDLTAEAGGLQRIETPITGGSRLALRQDGRELAAWPIAVLPDLAPETSLTEPPADTGRGVLRLDYAAADDYGVTALTAHIRRVGDAAAAGDATAGDANTGGATDAGAIIALDLIGADGGAQSLARRGFHDLSPHPWAGLEVEIRLHATDAAGQTGQSAVHRFTLPERRFHHPVARAIVEQRKRLSQAPDARRKVAAALWGLAALPQLFGEDLVVYLALRTATSRLLRDKTGAEIAPVQGLLWDTALRLEDGELSIAERELRELRRQLREAIERGAPEAEIARLMDEIRRALDRYLEALARAPEPATPERMAPLPPSALDNMVSRDDLQRFLDRMQDAMRGGARDSAMEMLRRLDNMLENLRAMPRGMTQRRNAARMDQMMRQMEDLAQQQQRLLDQTFRQSRGGESETGWLRDSQDALRRQLGRLMQMLGERFGDIPQALGQAEQAMRGAVEALGQGQPGAALPSQGKALEQLRQGVGQAMRQMTGEDGPGGFGDADELADDELNIRDPLGRNRQGDGAAFGGRVDVPDESALARSRRILEELRRRAADPWRRPLERDYIERLLDRF